MRAYLKYEGLPYLEGKDDCYGLARKFYKNEYEIDLSNYARPTNFAFMGMNLISENLLKEGFEFVDASLSNLELGDGITFSIARCPLANHIGIYVGNNMFLHHMYGQRSIAENFSTKWRSRVLNVVRHPLVTERNMEVTPEIFVVKPPHEDQ